MPLCNYRRCTRNADKNGRAVLCGRLLFIVCLTATAAGLGIIANYFLTQSEIDLTDTQFESIADRALTEAHQTALRKRYGAQTFATYISETHPNASSWPFVYIKNYERIADSILATISARDIAFSPIVPSQKLAEWEDFAYNYYYNVHQPPFPNDTAVNSFGRGIWKMKPGTPDDRTRDVSGKTSWGSPNDLLVPVFQLDNGADPVLLYNLHSEATRGRTIDNVVECAHQAALSNNSFSSIPCSDVTDILDRLAKYPTKGPGSAIYQPIYPANDPTVLVGFVTEGLIWLDVMENIFPNKVSGVDCIITTATTTLMYTITKGIPSPRGKKDLHQKKYDRFQKCVQLTDRELYSVNSTKYKMCVYPNDQFYNVYSTKNPLIATVGAVCIILLTSLFFFLYDFFVRREFSAKDDLLEAKRKFMRFVSHEVRTPLNSVSLGLGVLQAEIAASLGFRSAEELESSVDQGAVKESENKSLEWFNLAHEVRTNAQTAVDVLTDLLNYDKIENGKLALELSVLPIWTLIERTANEFKLPARNKEINLLVEFVEKEETSECTRQTVSHASVLPSSMVTLKVLGDDVRLTQVMRNLLFNAIKFTPQGGCITVRASCCHNDDGRVVQSESLVAFSDVTQSTPYTACGQLELSVTDTGVGMTDEQLASLYQDGLQFNVNALQAGQGSGIGLYIAKGIVLQHGGTITAVSEGLGHGTTFTIRLSLYDIPDAPVEESEPHVPSVHNHDGNSFAKKLKILVVDDVTSNRKLLCRLLECAGHDSGEAENGQVALTMARQAFDAGDQYDTILLDYEMPVMNGPDAAKEIRSFDPNVLIVGVTGNTLPEDVILFTSCGANVVLPKPLTLVDLERTWLDAGIVRDSHSARRLNEMKNKVVGIDDAR